MKLSSKMATMVIVLLGLSSGIANAKSKTSYSSSSSSSIFSFFEGNNDKELSLTATQGSFVSEKQGDDSITMIQVSGSLALEITDVIQAGAEIGFVNISGGGAGRSTFDLMAFGNYNFDTPINEAMYAKGGIGMFAVPKTATEYENKFGFMAGIGKRFPIWDKVNYNPEARLFKKGDADPSFEIQFLSFSIIY